MSDSEVIKEFLVAVGVKVDEHTLTRFGGIVGDIGRRVVTFATVLAGAATAVEVFVTKVSAKMEDLYWESQRLGSSVGAIQDYALGIQNLGGTAEGARSSLEGVMRLLRTNPGYGGLLSSIGVNSRAGGVGIMQQLGARFQHMPYFIAAQYAASLGIDEQTLWAMTHAPTGGAHGPVGSNAFSSIYRAVGMNPDKAAKTAHEFMVQLRDIEAQFTVLAEVLAYKLTPVARVFTQWIANSLTGVIEAFSSVDPKLWTELASSVGVLGTAFSSLLPTMRDTVTFLTSATKLLADALTVTKDVLAGDFSKAASDAGPIAQRAQNIVVGIGEGLDRWIQKAFSGDAGDRSRSAMNYFTSKGWSKEQAAGIVANLQYESGMDFRKPGDSGKAYGYGQWHGDRQKKFQQQFGHSIQDSTPYEQLQFVQWELLHSELAAGMALRRARTARDAAGIVNNLYERPLNPGASSRQREDIAARLAGGGAVAHINQKTNIHVNGTAGGAAGIARDVAAQQGRVNGDLLRNTKMVLQ